jgi:hypothetical protein
MDLLKASQDDYIAGISAQTIAVSHQRSTFDTIVDQFLRCNDTPSMIDDRKDRQFGSSRYQKD